MVKNQFSFEKVTWYNFTLDFFSGYAIAIFAFTAHTNIFMIQSEL